MTDTGEQPTAERFLPLNGKCVVLGVTGSIAAYKAADLASECRAWGSRSEVSLDSTDPLDGLGIGPVVEHRLDESG